MSKYVPAIFQPTVRPSWAGILSYVSVEEKSQILEAIIKYPTDTGIKSSFWEETIKPDLEMQYTKFVKANEAKGCGSRTYWAKGEDMDKISLPYDKHMDNICISRDKDIKDKDKDKDKNKGDCKGGEEKYGSLKNVILKKEQYEALKEKHPDMDDAIEELDTWLGKNSKSAKEARGKNHYAYFKSNSWVWERVNEKQPVKPIVSEFVPSGKISENEVDRIVANREKEEEEQRKRAEEANRRSEFIKGKGYPSMMALISAGKEVYDRIMSEYKQAQGF